MEIKTIEVPSQELTDYFEHKVEEFNRERWDIKAKTPLAIEVLNDQKKRVAGAAAKTFGNWLLIDYIWVSDELRGQQIGSKILKALEAAGIKRGCKYALLDTLDFQARPFYEKFGYKLEFTQSEYPTNGSKFFMSKNLL